MRPLGQVLNKYVALLLVFALFSLTLERTFAAPLSSVTAAPQLVGKLSTRGNRSIVVNGNNTEAGASILDGATIETPDGTGATISLGSLGEIDLAPNTVAELHYVPEQGPAGQVRLKIKHGCAIVRVKQGVIGSIETPDGTVTTADQPDNGKRKLADVCFPLGATTPVVNTGAAASAGAGASGSAAGGASAAAAAGATGEGISAGTIAATLAGIGAVIAGVVVGLTTDNESSSSPSATL
jgi:hypothetical protein